jgi:hypothetical protein
LLTRNGTATCELTPISTLTIEAGQRFNVPVVETGAGVWAEVQLDLSAFGKLKKTLYKSNEVQFEVVTADGNTHKHRFVPGMARRGFLLSPYIRSVEQFETLFAAESVDSWKADHLVSARFVDEGQFASRFGCFEPKVTITFQKLTWRK